VPEAIVNLDVERSLVVLDDAAWHDAVAAEVAALVGAGETVCRVLAADEDVWQAHRRAVTGERFDVVVSPCGILIPRFSATSHGPSACQSLASRSRCGVVPSHQMMDTRGGGTLARRRVVT
jgi:hypothetical protein